ncbi:hypothetical protein AFLA_007823 [Aspergillus flavus NRRL3357]|nr:hypothetical protein AFLA_007823 [Aspergillus flavus NRRL3357]
MNPENGDRVLRNAEWSGDASGAKCAPDDDDDQELVLQSGYLIEKLLRQRLNGGHHPQPPQIPAPDPGTRPASNQAAHRA